jgi:hypothetical protein
MAMIERVRQFAFVILMTTLPLLDPIEWKKYDGEPTKYELRKEEQLDTERPSGMPEFLWEEYAQEMRRISVIYKGKGVFLCDTNAAFLRIAQYVHKSSLFKDCRYNPANFRGGS